MSSTPGAPQKKIAAGGEDAEDVLRRLAVRVVGRWCDQHGCTADRAKNITCSDPEHLRDVDYLTDHLAMLGLKGVTPGAPQRTAEPSSQHSRPSAPASDSETSRPTGNPGLTDGS